MFQKTIKTFVQERKNVHSKTGIDWAFFVQFDDDEYWVIYSWDIKPTIRQIENVKDIFLRSCDVFYRNLEKPALNLQHNGEIPIYESEQH